MGLVNFSISLGNPCDGLSISVKQIDYTFELSKDKDPLSQFTLEERLKEAHKRELPYTFALAWLSPSNESRVYDGIYINGYQKKIGASQLTCPMTKQRISNLFYFVIHKEDISNKQGEEKEIWTAHSITNRYSVKSEGEEEFIDRFISAVDIDENDSKTLSIKQHDLGVAFLEEKMCKKNVEEARIWLNKSINLGCTVAQLTLLTVEKDLWETDSKGAMDMLIKCAEEGYEQAQISLAYRYYNGDGCEKDLEKTNKWWRVLADKGYSDEQLNLATHLTLGCGCPQNIEEANKYYRMAAEQDDPQAQYNLGMHLMLGKGCEKSKNNENEGIEWLIQSAQNGFPPAISTLVAKGIIKEING